MHFRYNILSACSLSESKISLYIHECLAAVKDRSVLPEVFLNMKNDQEEDSWHQRANINLTLSLIPNNWL